MITALAALFVLLTGLYLIALAAFSVIFPARAVRFLESFAGSAFAHILELSLRLCAGAALLLYAPHMKFTSLFRIFGWVLIVTTIGLLRCPGGGIAVLHNGAFLMLRIVSDYLPLRRWFLG